jgi:hypothetical protein
MGKLTYTTLGVILPVLISSASAQGNKAVDAPVSIATPSRSLSENDMAAYVESQVASFLILKQVTDPFGLVQDPAKAEKAESTGSIAVTQRTPLSEIVRLISITAIMPSSQSFLMNSRSVKQGDILPLSYKGSKIKAQVTEVSLQQVSFKNTDTGETASRKIDFMPQGMTSGGNLQRPSGLNSPENVSIELVAPEEDGKNKP